MNKIIAFLMAVTLGLIILAGCGESESDSSSSDSNIQEDVVINSFTCDQADILIREETTVTFTADVSSKIDLGPEDVRVLDVEGNQIGIMNDEGTGGDKKADDGIYTLTYSCESNETKVVPCYVVAGDTEGSTFVRLNFWRNYTDEDEACIHEVVQSLSADIATLNNESNEISEDDADEAMEILTDSLNCMIESGLVESYGIGSYCIYITVSTDWSFLYVLPVEGCASGISTYEPFLGTWNFDVLELYDFQATAGAAQGIDQTFATYNYDEAYTGDQVTVDSLKSVSDYDVILFNGHGGYFPANSADAYNGYWMVSIATNEAVDEEKYATDTKAGRTVSCYIENLDSYMAVTPYFFDYYLEGKPFSDDTLIYLSACNSCKDKVVSNTASDYRPLVDTLIDHGATAIIANTDTVSTLYTESMMRDILNYMCKTKEDGVTYYTLNEALSYAKEKNGANDGIHGAEVHAYFSAAVSDFSFQTGTVVNDEKPDEKNDSAEALLEKAVKSMTVWDDDDTSEETIYYRDGRAQESFFYDSNGIVVGQTEYEYDNNENLLAETTYNSNREVTARTEYLYDDNGNLLTDITYDGNGEIAARTEYVCDNNGNILTGTAYGSNGVVTSISEYTYDGKGCELSFTQTSYNEKGEPSTRTAYTYDSEGRDLSYRFDGRLGSDGQVDDYNHTYKIDYKYNSDGYTKAYVYLDSEDSISFQDVYAYDNNDRELTSKRFDSNGDVTYWKEYKYNDDGDIYESDSYFISYDDYGESVDHSYSTEFRSERTYDNDGHILTNAVVWTDDTGLIDGDIYYQEVYTYDEAGNVLAYIKDDQTDNPLTIEEYTFDSDGNMLTYNYTEYSTTRNFIKREAYVYYQD